MLLDVTKPKENRLTFWFFFLIASNLIWFYYYDIIWKWLVTEK